MKIWAPMFFGVFGFHLRTASSSLLLKYINSVFVLHLQLCRCICFIYWLSIEPEPYLTNRHSLSFAVRLHEFAERSVSFDFELYHRAILACHLEVNVVVLRLHSLLWLFFRHGAVSRGSLNARRRC